MRAIAEMPGAPPVLAFREAAVSRTPPTQHEVSLGITELALAAVEDEDTLLYL